MRNFKLKLLIITIFLGMFIVVGVSAADNTCVNLEVPLLGKPTICDPATYLSTIYELSVGLGVALAAVMIVIGGIQWITSQDNPGKIKEAQGKITGAIIGLVILFGSYLILRFINPKLVNLSEWQKVPTSTMGTGGSQVERAKDY